MAGYGVRSVFGGVFDEEFEAPSRAFFDQVSNSRFHLVTSALVQEEINPAPDQVQKFFDQILPVVEVIEISEETLRLRDAYIEAGIVSSQWAEDALHVALATVSGCALIVSWNFKHIVHFEKIPLYNTINVLKGYSNVGIFSPLEVIQT